MGQLHHHQEQGISATPSEPMASMHSPLCPRMAAETPALIFVLPATQRAERAPPLSSFSGSPRNPSLVSHLSHDHA